jgi:hypothetical protein
MMLMVHKRVNSQLRWYAFFIHHYSASHITSEHINLYSLDAVCDSHTHLVPLELPRLKHQQFH